tara:strand:+ start:948 stop:1394 length:447 start_codon:yes stop_codon:yes gene_type:complete
MFDIGGWEFLFIVILGIIVIGPKELPRTIKAVSSFVRRLREMSFEFQSGIEEVAKDAEIKKVTEELGSITDPIFTPDDLKEGFEDTIDPEGVLGETLKEEVYPVRVESDFNENKEVPTKVMSGNTPDSQKGRLEKEENYKSVTRENRK